MSDPIPESVHRLAEHLDVVGNAVRLNVLFSLEGSEKSVSELAEEHGRSEQTISRHLKLLRYKDFLESETRGRQRFYSVKRIKDLELLKQFRDQLQRDND